jgi:hypothetical protein
MHAMGSGPSHGMSSSEGGEEAVESSRLPDLVGLY